MTNLRINYLQVITDFGRISIQDPVFEYSKKKSTQKLPPNSRTITLYMMDK